MMNRIKKYYLLAALVLAVFCLMPALGEAEAAPNVAVTVVAASGYGELKFEPDLSEITLGVQTEAATVTAAQVQNAKIANDIFEQLLAIGVKKDALKTSGYSVSPIYQTENNGGKKPVVSGYRVSNSVIVTTSPGKVSQVIDTALKNGANQVNSLRFSLEDNKKATQDAISLSVKDALAKIDSIARALGKKVVRIQSVAEQGTNIRSMESRYMLSAKQINDSYESTPISAGTVAISANVQVTAELE